MLANEIEQIKETVLLKSGVKYTCLRAYTKPHHTFYTGPAPSCGFR